LRAELFFYIARGKTLFWEHFNILTTQNGLAMLILYIAAGAFVVGGSLILALDLAATRPNRRYY
jgi:hypothetical protein